MTYARPAIGTTAPPIVAVRRNGVHQAARKAGSGLRSGLLTQHDPTTSHALRAFLRNDADSTGGVKPGQVAWPALQAGGRWFEPGTAHRSSHQRSRSLAGLLGSRRVA
jgi:hypothetical protein